MCDIKGWCCYCKEDIYEDDDNVKFKNKLYHVGCYDLMKEELDEQ